MLRIAIGYDERESVAFYTLYHSLMARSSIPLDIIPLNRANIEEAFKRERGHYDSTDFAISRFMVPFLSGYKGWTLFMDCDMLCRVDIAEIANYINLANWYKAVLVCKHDYTPVDEVKFLNAVQTKYRRKNWSSLILFNNERCKKLTPEYVTNAPGLELHQFGWLPDDQIGDLPVEWNWLVGEYKFNPDAKVVHFTRGGPYFKEYKGCDYADEWFREYEQMTRCEQR